MDGKKDRQGTGEYMPSLMLNPDGYPYQALCVESGFIIRDLTLGLKRHWGSRYRPGGPDGSWSIKLAQPHSLPLLNRDWLAIFETVFTYYQEARYLFIEDCDLIHHHTDLSSIFSFIDQALVVPREIFWQQARVWTSARAGRLSLSEQGGADRSYFSQSIEKSAEPVYARMIPWLGTTLSFRNFDSERDLALFHCWMNDPSIAHFWQEEGDMEKHRAYLAVVAADSHVINLMACLNGRPFGYFEIYWAKDDRIAPFCDAQEFDRGWHVCIGEHDCRGRPFVTAWMPSISHYLFLDNPRTKRLVIEPRADNHKMIGNLVRNGYTMLKEFDFPHKRAALGVLSREYFFGEGLWFPRQLSHRPLESYEDLHACP